MPSKPVDYKFTIAAVSSNVASSPNNDVACLYNSWRYIGCALVIRSV